MVGVRGDDVDFFLEKCDLRVGGSGRVERIAESLLSNNFKVKVSFAEAGLRSSDVDLIVERIVADPRVVWLDLSRNHIGDDGCSSLCKGIVGSSVQYLSIAENKISEAGFVSMAEQLAGRRLSVKTIDVSRNVFTDKALESLCCLVRSGVGIVGLPVERMAFISKVHADRREQTCLRTL